MAKRTTKMEGLLSPMVQIHHHETRLQIFFTSTVADGILAGRRKSSGRFAVLRERSARRRQILILPEREGYRSKLFPDNSREKVSYAETVCFGPFP